MPGGSFAGHLLTGTQSRHLGLNDFAALLIDTASRAARLEGEVSKTLAARDKAFRKLMRSTRFPLSLIWGWRSAALKRKVEQASSKLEAAARERNACTVDVRFALSGRSLDAFADVAMAFANLTRTHISTVDVKRFSPAGSVVASTGLSRSPVELRTAASEFMRSHLPGLSFVEDRGTSVEIHPGLAVVLKSGEAGLRFVNFSAMSVECTEVEILEHERIPEGAVIVRQVWEKANQDGSPNRRFADNRQLPIVAYGLIRLALPGGLDLGYLVTDRSAARAFGAALSNFLAAVRVEPEQAPPPLTGDRGSDALGRDAWPEPDTEPVVKVPPPPHVARAHEYTLAVLAALPLTAFMVGKDGLPAWPTSSRAPDTVAASRFVEPPLTSLPPLSREPLAAPPPPQPSPSPEPTDATMSVAVPSTARPAVAAPVTPSATAPPIRNRVVVRTAANVRTGPDGTADVVRTAQVGMRLNIFGRAPGGWLQVGDSAAWGWVHSSLVGAVNE